MKHGDLVLEIGANRHRSWCLIHSGEVVGGGELLIDSKDYVLQVLRDLESNVKAMIQDVEQHFPAFVPSPPGIPLPVQLVIPGRLPSPLPAVPPPMKPPAPREPL